MTVAAKTIYKLNIVNCYYCLDDTRDAETFRQSQYMES